MTFRESLSEVAVIYDRKPNPEFFEFEPFVLAHQAANQAMLDGNQAETEKISARLIAIANIFFS